VPLDLNRKQTRAKIFSKNFNFEEVLLDELNSIRTALRSEAIVLGKFGRWKFVHGTRASGLNKTVEIQ